MDYTDLIAAVSFSGLIAAFTAVAAVKVAPLAARWGIAKVLSMIGR